MNQRAKLCLRIILLLIFPAIACLYFCISSVNVYHFPGLLVLIFPSCIPNTHADTERLNSFYGFNTSSAYALLCLIRALPPQPLTTYYWLDFGEILRRDASKDSFYLPGFVLVVAAVCQC